MADVLDALADFAVVGEVGPVCVVLGADATVPYPGRGTGWLTVTDEPVELADLYPFHDLLIARAGRNTTAEAAYCGIPAVLMPITADPHRGSEQSDNAAQARRHPGLFPLPDWHDPVAVGQTLTQALAAARSGRRRTGRRGNASAAAFITRLLAEPDRQASATTAS